MAFERTHLRAMILACCSAFVLGCGTSDSVTVYPVSGKITFEGKPMEGGGSISFIPTDERPGKTAAGVIDDTGSYVLGTYSAQDGSMPGEFRVVIRQITNGDSESRGTATVSGKPWAPVPIERQIPAIYSNFQKSPLVTQISETRNQIDFDLTREKKQFSK